jgi:succinate dehydrogenase / fumarate reductase membrane anchor subunit
MPSESKSLRTPLAQVRSLGSARAGAAEDWAMRLTSVALVPLTVAFVWLVLSLLHLDYPGVRAALGRPLPAVALALFVLVGLYHMHIGMRSILLDYVHGRAREWALMLNMFFCAALAVACVYALVRIATA